MAQLGRDTEATRFDTGRVAPSGERSPLPCLTVAQIGSLVAGTFRVPRKQGRNDNPAIEASSKGPQGPRKPISTLWREAFARRRVATAS